MHYYVLCQTSPPHFASQNNTFKEMVIELEGERTQLYSEEKNSHSSNLEKL